MPSHPRSRRSAAALAALLVILALAGPAAAQSTFQLNLTRPGTSGSVFIPGAFPAAVAASSLGSKRISNNTYPFISSLASPQAALAARAATLIVANTGSDHTLGLNLTMGSGSAQAFLAFTRGDHRNLQERMPIVTSGRFLPSVSPSFAYGLGSRLAVILVLRYANIDLASNLTAGSGSLRLVFTNTGEAAERQLVTIERS